MYYQNICTYGTAVHISIETAITTTKKQVESRKIKENDEDVGKDGMNVK